MFAKTSNSLFLDLHDLQRAGVLVNTRLILDDGELSIHWFMLDLPVVDWLGEAWGDNVVILPGVSLAEAEQFVDILYGRQNCDCDDFKVEPYEIYLTDQKCGDFVMNFIKVIKL